MKLSDEQSEELNNAIAAAEESAAKLAEKFGIGRNAVYQRAKKLGVKLPNGGGAEEPAEEISEEDSPEYGIADVLKAVGYLLTSLGNIIE